MSTEIVALIGVAAGALLNGGMQTLQHERERRVGARVAARLFSGDLARADDDVLRIITVGRWPDSNMPTYSREIDVWTDQREAFGAAVTITDYTSVAVAYQDLMDLPRVAAAGPPGREVTRLDRIMLDAVGHRIGTGYEVAANRSAPLLQRRRELKRFRKSQADRTSEHPLP